MESWSCTSEGKSFAPDETGSHSDLLARNRSALMGCDLKIPCTFESQGFGELGLPEMLGKHIPRSSTTSMASLNPFFREDESSLKLSSSIVESNSRDFTLFDLKLDAYTSKSSKGASFFSSSESSTPTKRMRVSGVYSQAAHCQVHGCNKDLSSSKDYHKRHKVCEAHSKTAKVIVKGKEQRFCQQCSRFHLLAEFDDGKRSCRKRLAGHNERRRKPQVSIHSGRDERLLHSYYGNRFSGTMFAAASFICQDLLPSSILDAENYRTSDWCRRIKVEGGDQHRSLSGVPVTNGQLHLKPVFSSHDIGKQYPPVHVDGTNNLPSGSTLSETGGQYPHNMRSLHSSSHSIYNEGALGSEGFNDFHTTASTVPQLSSIPESGCALSLLSSQSQNSTSYATGIPIAHPSVMSVSHTHYNLSQVSDKLCSQGSTSGVSNKFPSSDQMTISNGNDANDFGTNGIFQGSHFLNTKFHLPSDGGTTVDLLQLSTELQRVEDQRQSLQVKQEYDAFCCLQSPNHVK